MIIKPGILLAASPVMDDANFKGAIVLITEYNEQGAMGFVINKPFPRPLNELVEFRHSPAFPLFDGGPVDHEHLYFTHRRPDLISDGELIADGIYLGGNFSIAVSAINKAQLTRDDIKIFVGYCGWDAGELEAEIIDGYWTLPDQSINLFE